MRLALKGEVDILTPAAEQRVHAINSTPCPRCGTALQPKLAPPHALFSSNDALPKALGWCQTCGFEASAESSLVYHTGDPRRVDDPLPIIKPSE